MSLTDNKRLYDIATRLAVYVEGVKLGFRFDFGKLNDQLNMILARVDYRTLDGLSKAQLNQLIGTLRRNQAILYNKYVTDMIEHLQAFTKADAQVNKRVWATSHFQIEFPKEPKESFSNEQANAYIKEEEKEDPILFPITWTSLQNSIIPANGLTIAQMVSQWAEQAKRVIENKIKQAWVSRWTVKQTLDTIGQSISTIERQSIAVANTATGHIGNTIATSVSGKLFGKYVWISVMDNRTTEVCWSRHLNIYVYGKGPIPPAHFNCRSHISPIGAGHPFKDKESITKWLLRQPKSVIEDMVNSRGGIKAITVKEFLGKVDKILE